MTTTATLLATAAPIVTGTAAPATRGTPGAFADLFGPAPGLAVRQGVAGDGSDLPGEDGSFASNTGKTRDADTGDALGWLVPVTLPATIAPPVATLPEATLKLTGAMITQPPPPVGIAAPQPGTPATTEPAAENRAAPPSAVGVPAPQPVTPGIAGEAAGRAAQPAPLPGGKIAPERVAQPAPPVGIAAPAPVTLAEAGPLLANGSIIAAPPPPVGIAAPAPVTLAQAGPLLANASMTTAPSPPVGIAAPTPVTLGQAGPLLVNATTTAAPAPTDLANSRSAAAPNPRAVPVAPRDPQPPSPPIIATGAPAGQVFAAALHRFAEAHAAMQRDRDAAADTMPSAVTPSLAPTQTNLAVAATAATDTRLDTAQRHWPEAMIQRIVAMRDASDALAATAALDRDHARIRLSPDVLGSVEVSIERRDERMHVAIIAERPQAQALLADAQPRLAELADARGIRLHYHGLASDPRGGGGERPPQPATGQTAPTANRHAAALPGDTASDDRVA